MFYNSLAPCSGLRYGQGMAKKHTTDSPSNMEGEGLPLSPIIRAGDITARRFLGVAETVDGPIYVEAITAHGVRYLVAGGACNVGLLPTYLRERQWSLDEDLQDLLADIEEVEAGGIASGELLAWRGELAI